MNHKVKRYISVFAKGGDELIDEINFIHKPNPAELRQIFGINDPTDNLYNEYPIDIKTAIKLNGLIAGVFDLDKFDYFLSCERLTDL